MSLLYNPFAKLSKFEWILYFSSLIIVSGGFLLTSSCDYLTLTASLIGVTALILVSKGDSWGQILTAVFAVIYAVISWGFRYYGEMITYVGMSAPIAVLAVIEWVRHPYQHTTEVEVSAITPKKAVKLGILTIIVTFVFYFILGVFGTNNLLISTFSVATSFSASYLMLCRSPYYALAYAANDIVLIVLWVLASIESPDYIPMVLCFTMFFLNDTYGFINWKRMRRRQSGNT